MCFQNFIPSNKGEREDFTLIAPEMEEDREEGTYRSLRRGRQSSPEVGFPERVGVSLGLLTLCFPRTQVIFLPQLVLLPEFLLLVLLQPWPWL